MNAISKSWRSAFTLVELLVVIAIITILAAMLLPTLEKSLAASRQIFCLNNQKQLAVGIGMYLDDNNNFLPHHDSWGGIMKPYSYGVYTWEKANVGLYLQDSFKNPNISRTGGVFYCPEDRYGSSHTATENSFWTSSYAALMTFWGSNYSNGDKHINVSRIRRPGMRAMLMEQAPFPSSGYYAHAGYWYSCWDLRQMRHLGGHNVLFFDGAASFYPDPLQLQEWKGGLSSIPGKWIYGFGLTTKKCITAFTTYFPITTSELWIGDGILDGAGP